MRNWLPYAGLLLLCLAVSPAPSLVAVLPPAAPNALAKPDRRDSALPTQAEWIALAESNPVAVLDAAVARYRQQVQGYRCTLAKQETVADQLQAPEVIQIAFREQPFSARFDWREGGPIVDRLLYVDGENDNQLVMRLRGGLLGGLVPLLQRDPYGAEAQASSRYPLPLFGMGKAVGRSRDAWAKAQAAGRLFVTSRGIVPVPELGNRPCLVLERRCDPPEEEGLTELRLALDAETWLQTGSHLTASDGHLIGQYWFRDVDLNPKFAENAFTPAALRTP